MADELRKVWGWVEHHPWYAAGGIAGVGLLAILYFRGQSGGSGNPGQTFKQQLQWQKLIGGQQLAAIRAQEAPSLMQSREATAATLGTARLQAGSTNLANRLGLASTEAGYANNLKLTTLENQAQQEQTATLIPFYEEMQSSQLAANQQSQTAQIQQSDYLTQLQDFVTALENGWQTYGPGPGYIPGGGGNPTLPIYP